jgi:hypothetical protein
MLEHILGFLQRERLEILFASPWRVSVGVSQEGGIPNPSRPRCEMSRSGAGGIQWFRESEEHYGRPASNWFHKLSPLLCVFVLWLASNFGGEIRGEGRLR